MITFITLVAFFEAFVSYINHTQQKNSWKGIATLLRNETNSANSYQMSRILSDLEKVGWIKCVKLIESTNETRVFYDTTTQSYCGALAIKTEGTLEAINGSTWLVSFASPENFWLLILRVLIPFFIAFGMGYSYQIIERQRKQQEAARLRILLEKEHLFDLTKQTQHDVASPIGALKMVVQKLQAPPEYTELLRNITERIEGIFSQLKDVKGDMATMSNIPLEPVQIDKLVSKIVLEKENQWQLAAGSINTDLKPTDVIANELELGRVCSNLLNNAIEAKKEGIPPTIHITTRTTEKYYILKLTDNGVGMNTETLNNIGNKGFSYGKSDDNSGIGLYHAIKTLRSFGGDLTIQSEPNLGTTITLFLKYVTK